ncbi:hypothetical protein [Caulobacter sp. 17J80-11]|uniref:hypothetical protein n=1 Tax=Caulobacter sp. 17J80-11 TaxID=2763502 RepID=UPI001653DEC3|nr:hypothetical protein [Caulobacter sp. 17J80-11]MBC6981765.1 hypothetical protein [Caulobacter sp. 17J80-11]
MSSSSAAGAGARLSVVNAAFAGFRLIARRPLAVLVWGALYFAPLFLLLCAVLALAGADVGVDADSLFAGSSDPGLLFLLAMLAVGVLTVMVRGVVQAATMRAVLKPDSKSLGYLGWGRAELDQTMLYLVRGQMSWWPAEAVAVAFGAPLVAVGGVLASMAMLPEPWSFVGAGVFVIGAVVALAYLSVRMSIMRPLVFERGLHGMRSVWPLTRGMAWELLAMNIVAYVMALLTYVVPALLALVLIVGVLPQALLAGLPVHVATGQFHVSGVIAAVAAAALISLCNAVHHAVAYAPAAVAYQALSARHGDAAG